MTHHLLKDKNKAKICCKYTSTEKCICDKLVYKIRPNTFKFMKATYSHFEIIGISHLDRKIISYL